MATPHVSAVVALIASAYPGLAHHPAALVARLLATAKPLTNNKTRRVSGADTSPGDATGTPCPGGYCHLGGGAISNSDAYGAGLVDADAAVNAP